MEKLRTDILSSRALNASRKLHLPTYVATRFLLETVAGKKESSWIYEVIPRKYLIQDQVSFLKVLKFACMASLGDTKLSPWISPMLCNTMFIKHKRRVLATISRQHSSLAK